MRPMVIAIALVTSAPVMAQSALPMFDGVRRGAEAVAPRQRSDAEPAVRCHVVGFLGESAITQCDQPEKDAPRSGCRVTGFLGGEAITRCD